MDSITITLSKPIEHGKQTYTEIVFAREAEVGDLIAADSQDGEFGKMAAAFASIAEIPFPAFKKIRAGDMQKIIAEAGHLVGNAPNPTTDGAA